MGEKDADEILEASSIFNRQLIDEKVSRNFLKMVLKLFVDKDFYAENLTNRDAIQSAHISNFSSWSNEWYKKVDLLKSEYPKSACPYQLNLSPEICHAWLEKVFILTMRKLQISIINKAPKGSPFSLRNKGNKDEIEKELKKELKEIVKLKQSGLTIRQKFLYNLEDTIRQDIFKKTMKQNFYDTNKDVAEQLKQYLDERYPWLEWIVIAYNNKNKNESDTNAAYFNLSVSYSNGQGSRGFQNWPNNKTIRTLLAFPFDPAPAVNDLLISFKT